MKIGIISAMPEEAQAILNHAENLKKSQHGERSVFYCGIAGHEITLIEAGMGMLNAGWAATVLAAQTPDLIISAGFGGGVLPGLKVGDVVMAEQVLHWAGTSFERVEAGLYAPENTALPIRGCFITSEGILNKHDLKELLPSNANRPVVEMEGAAIARVAAEHNIPFMGIRAISDPWNEELSFSINEFCDDEMRIRPIKVLTTILQRPHIIPQLIRLAWNSRVAARSLSVATKQLFLQL
ncbi:MAG: hypothetical protein WC156_11445 [Pedobacter sp.]